MHDFTWFGWASDKVTHYNTHILTGGFVAALLILAAFIYNKQFKSVKEELVPDSKISLKNIFQAAIEALYNLIEGIIGHDAHKYFPLLASVFIVIFCNNLIGVIPGFLPATESINTNLAMSLTIFVYYNYVGIREQGLSHHVKHLMGPVWWLAWLIFPIELISHLFRPYTLGLRLMGNIFGDHVVVGVFSSLVPLLVPVTFMAFGIFVALVQAFVFTLLSSVYIGLAVAHEEH